MIPEGTSTHNLEDFAAEIWRLARDHASVLDSRTHITRIRDGLVYLRDHYEQRDSASQTLLAAKTDLAAKLVHLIRTVHETCPVCHAPEGQSHEPRCWLRCCTPGKWTQLTPRKPKPKKSKPAPASSVSVETGPQLKEQP